MAIKKQGNGQNAKANVTKLGRSANIAARGITNEHQFASLMSAMMSDAISSALTPGVINATCNAAGKLLKITELRLKYGRKLKLIGRM